MSELPEEKNILLDNNALTTEESNENSVENKLSNSEITLNSEIKEKIINQLLEEPITLKNENITNNNNDIPEPNCLALTVRKDYNLVIVKNIFTASGRLSWKIILATVVLNILNMLF